MAARCKICWHPRISEINVVLVAGQVSFAAIGRDFGVSESGVMRHQNHGHTQFPLRQVPAVAYPRVSPVPVLAEVVPVDVLQQGPPAPVTLTAESSFLPSAVTGALLSDTATHAPLDLMETVHGDVLLAQVAYMHNEVVTAMAVIRAAVKPDWTCFAAMASKLGKAIELHARLRLQSAEMITTDQMQSTIAAIENAVANAVAACVACPTEQRMTLSHVSDALQQLSNG